MKNTENRRAAPAMLTLAAGCNQLINWGISFYMPGTFARAIGQDTGWPETQIYLGLTIAMLIMALISPFVARLLARFGGQQIVVSGTLAIAAGCFMMAAIPTLSGWLGAWLLTGIGMRLALYDALFAALVNLYGQQARRTLSRVTLAGGLASALFWPLGAFLLTMMSWREALLVYGLLGLFSALLLWRMPNARQPAAIPPKAHRPTSHQQRRVGLLYAALIALVTFVSNGTSTHCPLRSASGSGDALGHWPDRRPFSGGRLGFGAHAASTYAADHVADAGLFRPRSERAISHLGGRRICAGLWRYQWVNDRV